MSALEWEMSRLPSPPLTLKAPDEAYRVGRSGAAVAMPERQRGGASWGAVHADHDPVSSSMSCHGPGSRDMSSGRNSFFSDGSGGGEFNSTTYTDLALGPASLETTAGSSQQSYSHILDCPVELLVNILSYVSDQEVFLTFRPACKQCLEIVKTHITPLSRQKIAGGIVDLVCSLNQKPEVVITNGVTLAIRYQGIRFGIWLLQNVDYNITPTVVEGISHLSSLQIHGGPPLTPVLMKTFQNLQRVHLHRLEGCCGYFEYMKNASDVRLSQIPSITDEDLYQLTKVKKLELGYLDGITQAGLRHVCRLPSLKDLRLNGVKAATGEIIEELSITRGSSVRVSLCGIELTTQCLRIAFEHIKYLRLSEIIVSSGVVEGLTVCPQWLDISNVPGYLSRGVVMYFGKYGKTIRLRDVLIRDEDLGLIRDIDTLELDGVPTITDVGISKLTGVNTLKLSRLPKAEPRVVIVGDLVCLENLELGSLKVTDEILCELVNRKRHTRLRTLRIERPEQLTPNGIVAALQHATALARVVLVKPTKKVVGCCPMTLVNQCVVESLMRAPPPSSYFL